MKENEPKKGGEGTATLSSAVHQLSLPYTTYIHRTYSCYVVWGTLCTALAKNTHLNFRQRMGEVIVEVKTAGAS